MILSLHLTTTALQETLQYTTVAFTATAMQFQYSSTERKKKKTSGAIYHTTPVFKSNIILYNHAVSHLKGIRTNEGEILIDTTEVLSKQWPAFPLN